MLPKDTTEALARIIDPIWWDSEDDHHILNNYQDQHIMYRATSLKKAESILEYLESIGILVDIKT